MNSSLDACEEFYADVNTTYCDDRCITLLDIIWNCLFKFYNVHVDFFRSLIKCMLRAEISKLSPYCVLESTFFNSFHLVRTLKTPVYLHCITDVTVLREWF